MINFVNTGADEAILKSMSTDGCSEDLIKAMNKQGLVQKDVTVQGKNGKTFTRKQWVKAGDTSQKSDAGVRTNTGDLSYKGRTISKVRRHGEVYYKIDGEKQLFSRENDAKSFIDKLTPVSQTVLKPDTKISGQSKKNNSSNASQQWQKKLEDALYSAPGTAADYAVGQVLKELPKGTVIKTGQKAMIASPPYELEVTYTKGDYDGWQYINKDYNTVYFNKVSNSICKVKDNSKFKLSVEVPNPTKDAQKTQTIDKTSKSSNKKTLDSAHFDSIKSDKDKALEYLKDCGVTWSENSHAGINWMRAMAAYKAATGGQKSTQKTSSTPTQPTSQPTTPTAQVAQNPQGNNGVKMSKGDAKKKTQSFTSKVGKTDSERKAFMDKVKAQGITWRDKADDGSDVAIGVSWMRCCMAMNKHFADGGSFDDSVTTNSTKSSVPKTLSDAGIDYGYAPSDSERTSLLIGATGYQDTQKKVAAYVKQAALDFNDPNIKPNVSFIMDNVIEVGLGWSKDFNSKNRYDLSRSDGAAFKKQIESHISDMKFTVLKSGKKLSDGQTTFWFRIGN